MTEDAGGKARRRRLKLDITIVNPGPTKGEQSCPTRCCELSWHHGNQHAVWSVELDPVPQCDISQPEPHGNEHSPSIRGVWSVGRGARCYWEPGRALRNGH